MNSWKIGDIIVSDEIIQNLLEDSLHYLQDLEMSLKRDPIDNSKILSGKMCVYFIPFECIKANFLISHKNYQEQSIRKSSTTI